MLPRLDSSSASPRSLPVKPIEWKAIARVPASELRVMLPGSRPHAPHHVAERRRGLVQKFRDRLNGAQRGDHGGDDANIDHESADPLGRGKSPPSPLEGGAQALNAFFTCTV